MSPIDEVLRIGKEIGHIEYAKLRMRGSERRRCAPAGFVHEVVRFEPGIHSPPVLSVREQAIERGGLKDEERPHPIGPSHLADLTPALHIGRRVSLPQFGAAYQLLRRKVVRMIALAE